MWFHAASLGEFEQGRPIIERVREEYPDHPILLTFFSPSGYEVRKDFDKVDCVHYLPLDTPGNARKFLDVVQPKVAVFIRYEYWYNFLRAMFRRHIPVIMVSSIFRKDQIFFKPYGGVVPEGPPADLPLLCPEPGEPRALGVHRGREQGPER